MSSPQVVDAAKIERAQEIAVASATAEKQSSAVADATAKDVAVTKPFDGDIDMTDAVAQAGRPLERMVIEKRLRELNPNFHFARSINDHQKSGIYMEGRFIMGMEWERSPEWTVKFIGEGSDGRQEMLHEVRGWRVIIDMLIRKGHINAEKTYKIFSVLRGRESAGWAAVHNR